MSRWVPRPRRSLSDPFKLLKRWIAILDQRLDLIANHFDYDRAPLSNFLYFREAKSIVSQMQDLAMPEKDFHIYQGDSRMDQCLWDQQGEITGWLDWEW